MATVHRILYVWFWVLLFLVLLVIRLDQSVAWNWFIIFIPMWILDVSIIVHDIVKLIQFHRGQNGFSIAGVPDVRRLYWTLSIVLLKLIFQILLCFRLEYNEDRMRVSLVVTPLWPLLTALCGDTLWRIVQAYR